MSGSLLLIDASAVRDANSPPGACRPGGESILVEVACGQAAPMRVLAVGPRHEVHRHERAPAARRVDLFGHLILPALTNAHIHLDLTPIGPQPYDPDGGFVPWVQMVRENRAQTPDAIHEAVLKGAEACRAGGTLVVGDIAGAAGGTARPEAVRAFGETGLSGVSFLEFFAIGTREQVGLDALRDAVGTLLEGAGVSPHAPNTVSAAAYAAAGRMTSGPIATHVAETPEEIEFIAEGTGPQRVMLEGMDIWDNSLLDSIGKGLHPVTHTIRALGDASNRAVFAHVNDAPDDQIEAMAKAGVSVAYCPRASDYFRRHNDFGPHRYREMLAAGVNVALGTDSIINLPPGTARLSTLDEARFLYERDGTDPALLLAMATVNGCRALGLSEKTGLAEPGSRLAGLVAVGLTEAGMTRGDDPFADVLISNAGPKLVS